MSPNDERPHVLILPEDDANRQLAVGFEMCFRVKRRTLQVLPVAKGWSKALRKLNNDLIPTLKNIPDRHIVVLIDCDGKPERIKTALGGIPEDVKDRVFIFGTQSEPENLKKQMRKSLEQIGQDFAHECAGVEGKLWQHEEIEHNGPELKRAKKKLNDFLFTGT